mmetsp:Transcript_29213/g.66564  ORF Transcript_29213/g.66564 Transcript_29213/m.66564 type:complete len:859 (-) Transcript_29213:2-2578(-)
MVSSALLGGTVLLLCGSAAVRCVSALQVSEETGRLLHGRVLGEESSSAVLDREPTDWWTRLFSGEGTAAAPENRRSHSATVYRYETGEDEMIEYMIISGGFTDQDWKTFPVWAYAMTDTPTLTEFGHELEVRMRDGDVESVDSPWTEMAPLDSSDEDEDSTGGEYDDNGLPIDSKDDYSSATRPKGRVGHLSSTYKDCLYIYGGLTYQDGSFQDDDNSMIIWKACGLDKLIKHNRNVTRQEDLPDEIEGLSWTKVVPKVSGNAWTKPLKSSSKSNNSSSEESYLSGDLPNRRAVGTPRSNVAEHSDPSTTAKMTFSARGEAQGGHFVDRGGNAHFIFYGGMHHDHTPNNNPADFTTQGSQTSHVLGDVWEFDYESETLTLLCEYPPPEWQRDERNGDYPVSRTAHAGTVVNNELIIHGGMTFGEEESTPSQFSNPSSTYATYKTSTNWQALADVWAFDLETLRWKERIISPQLARSYHSIVGNDNGTIAAFGGFQQDSNIPGETVAFVFKDLLVSRSNDTKWLKLLPPYDTSVARWRSASGYDARPSITNRLEHTAVLDQYGAMLVWGGRFQTVSQISGLWRLDVFVPENDLKYELAPDDGLIEYEAEIQALYLFIATMMFMSLTLSSIFSMIRRTGAGVAEGGGSGIVRNLTRRGLSRSVIDNLPVKRYEAPQADSTEDGGVVQDVSLRRQDSLEEDEMDSCAICLTEYEPGVTEVKTLPCGHQFRKECIDAWLNEKTTCPTCREVVGSSSPQQGEGDENGSWQIRSVGGVRRFVFTDDQPSIHWGAVGPTWLRSPTAPNEEDEAETSTDADSQDQSDGTPSSHLRFLALRQFFSIREILPFEDESEEDRSINVELV